ncbi:MAG TPA: hypothetical protein VFX17_03310 [Patescibacteria group bacterium]|nr:hypothetical protein [Patescibacteria group bacterium]
MGDLVLLYGPAAMWILLAFSFLCLVFSEPKNQAVKFGLAVASVICLAVGICLLT